MKTITINNQEYEIRYTIRALFIFEQIKGEAFQIRTTLDNYLFLYSMILASNKDKPLSWDDFLDAIDNDPSIIAQLNTITSETLGKDNLFTQPEDSDEKKS